MSDKNHYGNQTSAYAQMAGYAVEIQFFDKEDQPESQVTLPLAQFFNQNAAMGSSVSLGRWLK